jgi:hypothetical protein
MVGGITLWGVTSLIGRQVIHRQFEIADLLALGIGEGDQ